MARGYSATTVDAICEKAGLTKGSFYYFFTTIWDRLFGTFEPTNEPATNYFFWSTIRSYWMKLTCKPSATS